MENILLTISEIEKVSFLSPFLAVGFLILAGFFGGWVAHLVKLPHVTGNIKGGVLIGPWGLKFLDYSDVNSLAPL